MLSLAVSSSRLKRKEDEKRARNCTKVSDTKTGPNRFQIEKILGNREAFNDVQCVLVEGGSLVSVECFGRMS